MMDGSRHLHRFVRRCLSLVGLKHPWGHAAPIDGVSQVVSIRRMNIPLLLDLLAGLLFDVHQLRYGVDRGLILQVHSRGSDELISGRRY